MRFLPYLKYLFFAIGVIISALYILDNNYINKYILAGSYILFFLVTILDKYEKRRISISREEK